MTPEVRARPFPLVLAGPSGSGKTTIARELVGRFPRFTFSVSATTRRPRSGEEDGADYAFVSHDAFQEMMERGELVEWAEVHGNLYGTPREQLDAAADADRHPVLDIDVQGARQVRERVPEAVLVFVFPPSAAVLRDRLTARGTETEAEVERRLRTAAAELEDGAHFDYVVVNEELETAVADVRTIVDAECHRTRRIQGLRDRVARLRREILAMV